MPGRYRRLPGDYGAAMIQVFADLAALSRGAAEFFIRTTRTAKAVVVPEVRQGPRDPRRLPAQLIKPERGELRRLLDRAAAGVIANILLNRRCRSVILAVVTTLRASARGSSEPGLYFGSTCGSGPPGSSETPPRHPIATRTGPGPGPAAWISSVGGAPYCAPAAGAGPPGARSSPDLKCANILLRLF